MALNEESEISTVNSETAPSIDIDVKVGILHTIANAIYATPAGKIREAVANATDNEASWIVIVADQTTNTLVIYDNGRGISAPRFQEIFMSIGYGLLSSSTEKLSYFGLGLMSIFQLGKKVKIFTRPKDQDKTIGLLVESDNFFDENNREKSIKELRHYIKFVDAETRDQSSAPNLNQFIDDELGGSPLSFTEIAIEDINPLDMEIICGPGFVNELRKALPLRIEADEPFLKRFTGPKSKDVRKLLENKDFCRTINVFFGIRGRGSEETPDKFISQLSKYFPKFSTDISFPDANVYVGISPDGSFGYYMVHTVAQDLHRDKPEEKENGFWVRNQNFLVKAGDFLEKPGPGWKSIDQPLRNWIFGEIFHRNMNHFLNVSRTEFLFDDHEFREFRQSVINIIKPMNLILREIWERKRKIVDGVIKPFEQVTEVGGPILLTEQILRRMANPQNDSDFYRSVLEKLEKRRHKEIEVSEARVDALLPALSEMILLGEDEDIRVFIDPEVRGEHYQVSWDAEQKRVRVAISPELFAPREVVFLNKTFTLAFVAKTDCDPGVSVDTEKRVIWVNPFNEELTRFSISILDILIALEVAYASSQNMDELKTNFLMLIGAKEAPSLDYIVPLGDELRRAFAFGRGE